MKSWVRLLLRKKIVTFSHEVLGTTSKKIFANFSHKILGTSSPMAKQYFAMFSHKILGTSSPERKKNPSFSAIKCWVQNLLKSTFCYFQS
jgi:hypothetical protein